MNQDIVDYARECLGTPYMHQGRVLGKAMDCAGICIHVLTRLNLKHVDGIGYPRTPFKGMLPKILEDNPHLTKVHRAPEAGDFMLIRLQREPDHLAICSGANMIHAYYSTGRVVEHSMDDWKRRIVSVYEVTA